jgi:hypothetical protein
LNRSLSLILTGFLAAMVALAVYNKGIDRWGVFSRDYRSFYTNLEFNYHYLKTRYVLEDPGQFNCFVFGSSRVAGVDAELLGRHAGLSCYNFTNSGGTPIQHLHDLRLFLDEGVEPTKIFIGVDDLAYTWDNSVNDQQYARRNYPSGPAAWLGFYSMYLLRMPGQDDLDIWQGMHPLSDQPWWIISDGADGLADNRSAGKRLYDDPQGQRLKFAKLGPTLWYQDDNVEQSLQALESIQALADEHGFELEIFFNPMHYKTYLANDWSMLRRFKRGLAERFEVYDFSGFNAVTLDDRYWAETSHYTTQAGDRMIGSLLGNEQIARRFGHRLDESALRTSFQDDTNQAAALFPKILRQQSGVYLPAQVAGILLQGADGESLIRPEIISAGDQSILSRDAAGAELVAFGRDPQLYFEPVTLSADQFGILEMDFSVAESGWAQLYFARKQDKFSRKRMQLFRTRPGRNHLFLPLWPEQDLGRFRLDPGKRPGRYLVHEVMLHRLPSQAHKQ